MGKITVVTSGKGGTGKSTFSVGIASAFANLKMKTLLIDLDEGLRCLDLMLGVSSNLVFDISDILSGDKTFLETRLSVNEYIDLIPAPENVCGLDFKKLFSLVKELIDNYDHIILDCSAGIDRELLKNIPKYADVYIVEQLNQVGSRSASKIEEILSEYSIENKFLILNKFDYYLQKDKFVMSIDDIMNSTGLMLKGVIPYDDYLDSLSSNGKLYYESTSFPAFIRIAKRMSYNNIPLPDLKKL